MVYTVNMGLSMGYAVMYVHSIDHGTTHEHAMGRSMASFTDEIMVSTVKQVTDTRSE